jgi:hypothetical protein
MKRWTVAVHRVFAVLSFSESPYSKSATLFFLQTVFQAASWKLREEFVLAFIVLMRLITVAA